MPEKRLIANQPTPLCWAGLGDSTTGATVGVLHTGEMGGMLSDSTMGWEGEFVAEVSVRVVWP